MFGPMEEQILNSSQESLPISQETSNYLWDIINQDGNGHFLNDLSEVSVPVPVQSVRSSLPAITDWPGDVGFNVTFGAQEVRTSSAKHINWIFSEKERKLYVKKDVPCPINFSANVQVVPGAVVRAMAVYTSPQHASESVHRCVTHSMEELDADKFEAEHLIRSECGGAAYIQHAENKRHSVVVPFENAPAGQCFATYIYKFACWSSCAGGPNRRPLTLVFTLEQNDTVIGRRTMDLKICACPGRDSGTVPKTPQPSASCSKKPKMEPEQQIAVASKRKFEEKSKYVIETSDFECLRFLQEMKRMYKMKKKLSGLPNEYKLLINVFLSSSSEDEGSASQQQ